MPLSVLSNFLMKRLRNGVQPFHRRLVLPKRLDVLHNLVEGLLSCLWRHGLHGTVHSLLDLVCNPLCQDSDKWARQ